MLLVVLDAPQIAATTIFKSPMEQKILPNSTKFIFNYKNIFNVNNTAVLLKLSTCYWFLNRKIRNHVKGDGEGLVCDVLRDLVPFVQFKKREKHPWRSVTFSKVADFPP